jgi:hypothetical protein
MLVYNWHVILHSDFLLCLHCIKYYYFLCQVEVDLCSCMVGLWSRITDRVNIKEVYRELTFEEQAQVSHR